MIKIKMIFMVSLTVLFVFFLFFTTVAQAEIIVPHYSQKNANNYYMKGSHWINWGNYGMQCDRYWSSSGIYFIQYMFSTDASTIIDQSLEIGVEFKASGVFWNNGPDLYVYNFHTANWVLRQQSMGKPSSLIWNWYTMQNSNQYVSSTGQVAFAVGVAAGCHAWVNRVGLKWSTYETLPDSPTAFDAYNTTSDSIQLSWIKGSNSDKTMIRRKIGEYPTHYTDGALVYSGSATSCTDSDLSSGNKYYYSAWGVNSQVGASDLYSENDAKTLEFTKPDTPTVFSIQNITSTTAELSWIKGQGSDKTMIRRKLESYPESYSDGFEVYFDEGTYMVDTNLIIGTDYYYRIWSFNNDSGYYSDNYAQNQITTITYPNVQTIEVNYSNDVGMYHCKLQGFLLSDGGEECQIQFKIRKEIGGSWWTQSDWRGSYSTGESFNGVIMDLEGNTTYLFMAGARNCAGEKWGEILNFTTQQSPPSIDYITSYYADGSEASQNGFILPQIELQNTYTAFIIGENADKVKFSFELPGTGAYYEYIDEDGSDGWTVSIDFSDMLPATILNVSAYNHSFDSWGKIKSYYPKIISTESWMDFYFNSVKTLSHTKYAIYSEGKINDPPLSNNNYYYVYAFVDFSKGSPLNEQQSIVNVLVPGGVPGSLGGEYGYSGGIGSSIFLSSTGTIEVSGQLEASIKIKNIEGSIAATITGDLSISDSIIWNDMFITVNGEVNFPIFYVPFQIFGIGLNAGIDINPFVEITFELQPTNDPNQGLIPGLGIKIKEDGGISGHVGCSIISYIDMNILIAHGYIEAGGRGTLYFTTPSDENPSYFHDFELNAWIGGRVRLLLFTKEYWYRYNWRWSDGDNLMILNSFRESNETNVTWELINTSYLDPDEKEYNHFAWQQWSNSGPIIENVFPYANPSMDASSLQRGENEKMIVWAHHNQQESLIKGMELRYSLAYSNGFITPPETIPGTYDDNRVQMDPQILFDKNGNAVCVFTQIDSDLLENTSIDEVFNSTEIAYCIWDSNSGSWSDIQNITDNDHMDAQPILAKNTQGDIVLVWASYKDPSFQTASDGNIYASFWNGTNWSEINHIVKDFPLASLPHVALNDNGTAICVFTGDYDGDPSTTNDQNIFYQLFQKNHTGEIQQFTFDYDHADTNPSAIFDSNGKPYIIWTKNMYKYLNGTKINDATIFYKGISSSLLDHSERMKIINGTVSSPLVLPKPSTGREKLLSDNNPFDFAVFYKTGALSDNLGYVEIDIEQDRRNMLLGNSRDNESNASIIYVSNKKLSEFSACFTSDGSIAVVTTQRQTLKNGSKNSDLSFFYSAPDNFPPHPPSNPNPKNGVMDINIHANLSWDGGDPNPEDIVTYDVYFGNNSDPPLVVSNISESFYNPGLLQYETVYYWKIVSKDDHGASTIGPLWSFTTLEPSNPPLMPETPSGQSNGMINTIYTYTTSTNDPDGDPIYYLWDWGDGTVSDWFGPYESGVIVSAQNSWSNSGSYQIKVKAKDIHGFESNWSSTKTVSISAPSPPGAPPSGPPGLPPTDPVNPEVNIPPVSNAGGPYEGYVGFTITFSGTASYDTDGSIVGYRWDYNGDGSWDTDWLTSPTTSHIYEESGNYTIKLEVKDNWNATDINTTTASVLSVVTQYTSNQTLSYLFDQYGLDLIEPFQAIDTTGDGKVDTFIDPNNLTYFIRLITIDGERVFLISTEDGDMPDFFWNPEKDEIALIKSIEPELPDPIVDTQKKEITFEINVEKADWIYIKIIDVYPHDEYPDFTFKVKTSDERTISLDMIWRENGFIYVLDDPDVQYIFIYSYNELPANLITEQELEEDTSIPLGIYILGIIGLIAIVFIVVLIKKKIDKSNSKE